MSFVKIGAEKAILLLLALVKIIYACVVKLLFHFENKECLDQEFVLRHEVHRLKSRFPHQLKYSRL